MTRPAGRPGRPLLLTAALAVTALVASACGGEPDEAAAVDASDWDAVLAEAQGQSVDWYMYGGDQRLNDFVNGEVADRLAELGVSLNQVKITDTAEAVNKVLGEQQAGRTSGGSVDAIWVNGENFATGVQADLWACGWTADLPNAKHVDLDDPAVATDFGVPVEGCEAAWQQASSALVYDSAVLDAADVESVESLLAWTASEPGRFTHPAPPDFTGSMAVRTFLYDALGAEAVTAAAEAGGLDDDVYEQARDETFDRLLDAADGFWRGGETYPVSQEEVEKLYADGEISAFLTYGPGAVSSLVEDGVFPGSTRETVLSVGNISNVSFLGVPANAEDRAGAMVLADVLQDPEVQLGLYEATGIFPVIDLDTVEPALAERFAAVDAGPSVLSPEELTADALPELDSATLARIEDDWRARVLRGEG
ncbi:ABC transporter substrate-binding protein [Nocardioides sp. 31GB23]|uniref:ABC transporter substrate-binding protein n=1 Tax=Nocardioides sp. 31GB23 TaxID=3156065 RepID=UPI0032B00CDB